MSQTREDVRARLRPFGLVFEKSLSDLIKGIRSHKDPEAQAKFLQDAISECRKEVRSADMELKTMAVLKLAYLEMWGYDMSWASFHVLEVMSSPKFQQKRVGYLAASQCFRNDNDVLMLTTNLLRKDLSSSRSVDVGVALSGIASVVTTPLASDITDDIVKMLGHSKPYIRKKAIAAMYKIFLKYPEALRTHLPRIVDKLDDEDESVVTATITVLCELSKKTPKLLVQQAPRLYDLLQSSNNNWMLIRLLKLFSSLSIVEPRLRIKLLNPVLELMAKTKSSSLIYECINCLVTGNMIDDQDYNIADMCLEELIQFFDKKDSNLKYVGLLAFYKIGKINSNFISKYSSQILEFLADDDLTIREKALDLVDGVVNDENLFDVVKILIKELVPQEEPILRDDESQEDPPTPKDIKAGPVLSDKYKINIVQKITQICAVNNYSNIPSFEWYIAVLTDLIDLSIVNKLRTTGEILGEQFKDIAMRVPSIRKLIVSTCSKILVNDDVLSELPQVLSQVVWVSGEYSSFIKNGDALINKIINQESKLALLSAPETLTIYIPAIIKIFSNFVNKDPEYWDSEKADSFLELSSNIVKFLEKLSISKYFEVQERSVEFLEFMKLLIEAINQHEPNAIEPPLLLTVALPGLFNAWEIKPISHGSQKRIPIPEDLDLDSPIYEDIFDEIDNNNSDSEEFEEDLYEDQGAYVNEDYEQQTLLDSIPSEPLTSENIQRRKQERLEKLKDDIYYLSNDSESQTISPRLHISSKDQISTTPRSLTPTLIEMNEEGDEQTHRKSSSLKKKKKKDVVILSDEVIGGEEPIFRDEESQSSSRSRFNRSSSYRKNLLKIDDSNLDKFTMMESQSEQDEELNRGKREIEKIRQQVQHEEEANSGDGADEEVIVVRKKKSKKKHKPKYDENGNLIEKPKKKKKSEELGEVNSQK